MVHNKGYSRAVTTKYKTGAYTEFSKNGKMLQNIHGQIHRVGRWTID